MGKTLSFLDKSFWITESDANPKHVACLQLLAMPEHADKDHWEHDPKIPRQTSLYMVVNRSAFVGVVGS